MPGKGFSFSGGGDVSNGITTHFPCNTWAVDAAITRQESVWTIRGLSAWSSIDVEIKALTLKFRFLSGRFTPLRSDDECNRDVTSIEEPRSPPDALLGTIALRSDLEHSAVSVQPADVRSAVQTVQRIDDES